MLCLLSFKILLRTCLCHFVLGFRWNTLLLYNLGSSGRTDKMPAREERQPNVPVRGFDEQNEILDKDQSEFWDGLGEVSSLFYFWSYIEVMKKPRKANLLNSLFGEEASAFSMWKITFCETYFFFILQYLSVIEQQVNCHCQHIVWRKQHDVVTEIINNKKFCHCLKCQREWGKFALIWSYITCKWLLIAICCRLG